MARPGSQACASIPPESVLLSRRAAQGARFGRMIRLFCCFALALLALFAAGKAQAHPHVWVTMKSELVYAPDGSVTGVRHAWTFDDMFSTYATQGLESK